jgi:hypothetical protein
LSLAAIALRAYRRSSSAVDAALSSQLATSASIGNVLALSQALFALEAPHDDSTFAV